MNMKKYNLGFYSRMRFRTLIIPFLLLSLVLVYRCSTTSKMQSTATNKPTLADTIAQGRQIYVNNCGSCHNLFQPERFTAEQWVWNVNKMQKRAKVDDVQKEVMLKYLFANSKK